MSTLNKFNFFEKVQQILENYYLQPLNAIRKNDLKDGFLERTIHGAIHACRTALWALVMHNFLLQRCPDYVNRAMDKIAQQLNIETEEVLLIILITMICHDAARKGEGHDLWEVQSAQVAKNILLEIGLDDAQAQLFSAAIECKDKPEQ